MGIDILPQKPKPKCENRHSMGGVYYALEIIAMVTYGDYVYSDPIEKLQMALRKTTFYLWEIFFFWNQFFFAISLLHFFSSSISLIFHVSFWFQQHSLLIGLPWKANHQMSLSSSMAFGSWTSFKIKCVLQSLKGERLFKSISNHFTKKHIAASWTSLTFNCQNILSYYLRIYYVNWFWFYECYVICLFCLYCNSDLEFKC